MLDTTTKRRIDTARDILVGKVPDPKSQVEQITIALIYKFMDDMDLEAEELGGIRSFFTGEYDKYSWHKLFDRSLSGFEVLGLYGEALVKLSQNPSLPQLFRDIFKNAYLPYRDPETLKSFIKIINDFTYDHSERLGDAFEYLLSVLGSQGDAGQFRTPRHIIDFMVKLIDPKKTDTILDPACGTAGFLISSYKHIWKNNSSNYTPTEDKPVFAVQGAAIEELGALNGKNYNGDKLTPEERSRLIENICGYDISPDMVRLSLVNLYLHGFTEPHIYEYDTLTSDERWNEYYDIIMANPPFMSPKGGIRPHKRFSMESSRSEVLFVDYIAEHLKPTGRAAIIVPEGIVFQEKTAYKKLRKLLVEENYLVGVISLPAGVFNPYANVKTSVLWIDKSLARKTEQVLFVKIVNDGFDLGAQRRPIKLNDLPETYQLISAYRHCLETGEEFQLPEKSKITLVKRKVLAAKGGYNLSGERYLEPLKTNTEWPLKSLSHLVQYTQLGLVRNKSEQGKLTEGFSHPYVKMDLIDWNGGLDLKKVVYVNATENELVKYSLQDGDFIYNTRNAPNLVGKCAVFHGKSGKFIFNNNLLRVRFKDDLVNADYVNRLIVSEKGKKQVQGLIAGTTSVAAIYQKEYLSILIPVPPLAIQYEIISEIESYQKIINGARQVVENYKPRIDIDPEWEMVELGEVFNKVTESVLPANIKASSVIYIGLENISQGTGEIVGKVEANPIDIKSTKTRFKPGDILYGKLRPNLNKVNYSQCEGICSTDIIVMRGKEMIEPRLYSFYFLSERFNQEVMKGLKGAQLPRVGYDHVSKILIPCPPIEAQKSIVTHLEEEHHLIAANKRLFELYEQKIKDRIAKVWGE